MAAIDLSCIYFIATEEFIVRSSAKEVFRARAYSGGARTTEGNRQGDKRPEKIGVAYTHGKHHDISLMSFNPDRPTLGPNYRGTGTAKQAGGPIPTGRWAITAFDPTNKGQGSLRLTPDRSVRAVHPLRDFDGLPFLIHATGKWGSWGCITMPTKDLHRLFKTLKCTGEDQIDGLDIPLNVYFNHHGDTFGEFLGELEALKRMA
jgi:hypothetical protein